MLLKIIIVAQVCVAFMLGISQAYDYGKWTQIQQTPIVFPKPEQIPEIGRASCRERV